MEYVFIGDTEVLDALNPQSCQSPEDFLASLEEQLENGEITVEEAIQAVRDFTTRSK